MTYKIYDTAGIYIDTTNSTQYVYANNVTFISSFNSGTQDVFVNSKNVNLKVGASGVYYYLDYLTSGSVNMNTILNFVYTAGDLFQITVNVYASHIWKSVNQLKL